MVGLKTIHFFFFILERNYFLCLETSDFAAACGRARAFADRGSRPKFETGSSTSPEPSPNDFDVSRFDFPVAQRENEDDKPRFERGNSFYEDETMIKAKKDIATILGLGVTIQWFSIPGGGGDIKI